MKKIHLNLKRFDIEHSLGGVNRTSVVNWASEIINTVSNQLEKIQSTQDCEFVVYLPEAHIIPALTAQKNVADTLQIGCQSVHFEDVEVGGNFGAFTTLRPAKSMTQLSVNHTIIGHCEERKYLKNLFNRVTTHDTLDNINAVLNEKIQCAQYAGMQVLYCIGETLEERDNWQDVLKKQLDEGLKNVDLQTITIAYEPVWAIGPGRPVPTKQEIEEIVCYIKQIYPQLSVIYGGGLKEENAADLASISSLDGGLIALTRFSGEFGFYPEEYLTIIKTYLNLEEV